MRHVYKDCRFGGAEGVSILYLRCGGQPRSHPATYGCNQVSILYIEMLQNDALDTNVPVFGTVSILYLRCTNNIRRGAGRAVGIVSILYLRCLMFAPKTNLLYCAMLFQFSIWDAGIFTGLWVGLALLAFQFSIWDASYTLRRAKSWQWRVPILYLRCLQIRRHHKESYIATRVSILYLRCTRGGSLASSYRRRRNGRIRVSILCLRCHNRAHKISRQVVAKCFNSLFEMRVWRPWAGGGQVHVHRFNSLFEMRQKNSQKTKN